MSINSSFRNRRLAAISAGLVALAALAAGQAVGANSADRDPQRTAIIDKNAAAGIVQQAVAASVRANGQTLAAPASNQVGVANVSDVVDGALSRYYDVTSDTVIARVDAHFGNILTLLLPMNVPGIATGAGMSATDAKASAIQYLQDTSVPTTGLTPQLTATDRGPGLRTYKVVWSRRVNGILMPDERMVELDASTGAIFRMHDVRRTVADPSPAKVARDQAVAAAKALVGYADASLAKTDLVVRVSPDGSSRTVWTVELYRSLTDGTVAAYKVEVDAVSGGATLVATG